MCEGSDFLADQIAEFIFPDFPGAGFRKLSEEYLLRTYVTGKPCLGMGKQVFFGQLRRIRP